MGAPAAEKEVVFFQPLRPIICKLHNVMHAKILTLDAMFFMQCPEIHASLHLADMRRQVHPLWRMVESSGTFVPPKAIILLMPTLTLISATLATWLICVDHH